MNTTLTSIITIKDVIEKSLKELLEKELSDLYEKIQYEVEQRFQHESIAVKKKFVSKASVFTLEILQKINQNGLSVEFKI